MDVIHRSTFEMYTKTSDYLSWDEHNFWQFVAEDAEANLDLSFFSGASSYNMTKQGIYGEYFLDFLTDDSGEAKFRTQGVLWKTPQHPRNNKTEEELRSEYGSKVQKIGKMREDGADKIPLINDFLAWSGLKELTNSPEVANLLMKFNFLGQDTFVAEQSNTVNDGFWVAGAPNVFIAAYFVPIENSFAAFDYVREMARARHYGGNDQCFRFNDPVEYRFVEVTNDSLLQIVPPGNYVVSEILGFTDASPGTDAWQRAYAEIECEWTTSLGGVPHIMKLHSFGEDDAGNMRVLQPCKACGWIPDSKKKAFEEVRQQYDPHGLFATGFAHNVLLQSCPAECQIVTDKECPPKGVPDCGSSFV